nr:MAG TPA: hypothetical protein [Caudoviricetes sp.]
MPNLSAISLNGTFAINSFSLSSCPVIRLFP